MRAHGDALTAPGVARADPSNRLWYPQLEQRSTTHRASRPHRTSVRLCDRLHDPLLLRSPTSYGCCAGLPEFASNSSADRLRSAPSDKERGHPAIARDVEQVQPLGSAERERVDRGAPVEELDLEETIGDWTPLADQLVHPRVDQLAGTIGVDIAPRGGTRRRAVDRYGERHGRAGRGVSA